MTSKYEYKAVQVVRGMSLKKMADNIQTQLDEMSAAGWDLHQHAVEGAILIYRRPKS